MHAATLLELRDITGRVVLVKQLALETPYTELEMAFLSEGTYMLSLRLPDGRIAERAQVIKQ
ncbi:MAG: hypothetical protein IPM46_05770 [Flavobacteriales bacterium]|nr:hypothetical protein [Flavobacteriales bacterium]